ncbi:MAG: pyrroline-5-carboxylate reductase [Bacillota bacterium]
MKLGFVGAGNMAQAILKGALDKHVLEASDVLIYDPDTDKAQSQAKQYGVTIARSNAELCAASDIVLLAVKPNVCASALKEIGTALNGKALISIVAGWDMRRLQAELDDRVHILRVMPNTPSMVGEGMTAFDQSHTLLPDELAFATSIFSSIGRVISVPDTLMSAVTGVSGSGPAYVYLFIEALADAGVLAGLPRATAYELAAQTVVGAGKMVLETGLHPGVLKDAVCSPGGTTIEAVYELESAGFRAAVMRAVDACILKAGALSKG